MVIFRRRQRIVMGYKTTTDPFVLRGTTDFDITGTSGFAYGEIDTSLDTLNREVLLIWEIDIQAGDLPRAAINGLLDGAAMNQIVIRDSVLTEKGAFNVADNEYIGGQDVQVLGRGDISSLNGTAILYESKNPDANAMLSVDKVPLAIVTASTLILRSDFTSSVNLLTTDGRTTNFRIHAQRAKADADTYAALVTGLI